MKTVKCFANYSNSDSELSIHWVSLFQTSESCLGHRLHHSVRHQNAYMSIGVSVLMLCQQSTRFVGKSLARKLAALLVFQGLASADTLFWMKWKRRGLTEAGSCQESDPGFFCIQPLANHQPSKPAWETWEKIPGPLLLFRTNSNGKVGGAWERGYLGSFYLPPGKEDRAGRTGPVHHCFQCKHLR